MSWSRRRRAWQATHCTPLVETRLSMRSTDGTKYDLIQREYWTSRPCSYLDFFVLSRSTSSAPRRPLHPLADSACAAASASARRRRPSAAARRSSASDTLASSPSNAPRSASASAVSDSARRASASTAPVSSLRESMSRRIMEARSRSSARRAIASARPAGPRTA